MGTLAEVCSSLFQLSSQEGVLWRGRLSLIIPCVRCNQSISQTTIYTATVRGGQSVTRPAPYGASQTRPGLKDLEGKVFLYIHGAILCYVRAASMVNGHLIYLLLWGPYEFVFVCVLFLRTRQPNKTKHTHTHTLDLNVNCKTSLRSSSGCRAWLFKPVCPISSDLQCDTVDCYTLVQPL